MKLIHSLKDYGKKYSSLAGASYLIQLLIDDEDGDNIIPVQVADNAMELIHLAVKLQNKASNNAITLTDIDKHRAKCIELVDEAKEFLRPYMNLNKSKKIYHINGKPFLI